MLMTKLFICLSETLSSLKPTEFLSRRRPFGRRRFAFRSPFLPNNLALDAKISERGEQKMKGRQRRQRNYGEFFRVLKESERELEALERLWELGVVRWRDERRYRSEVEPFNYDLDADSIKPNILRVIR
jgi:hypothetical protein